MAIDIAPARAEALITPGALADSPSRQEHRAQRKLDQLRHDRRLGEGKSQVVEQPANKAAEPQARPGHPLAPAATPDPICAETVAQPGAMLTVPDTQHPASGTAAPVDTVALDAAVNLIETACAAVESAGKPGGLTWTQAFQKRQAAKRIADNLKKKQADHAARRASPGGQADVATV